MTKKVSLFEWMLKLLIGIAISIALINYFSFRSLWLDEAMLALNIVNRSPLELLTPLDMNQVAPIGFLMIEKFFATVFDNRDWAFRIFPFLTYLLAIPLFYLLNVRLTEDKRFALFATVIFSLSVRLIAYSGEAKQYMSDVLICIIIALGTFYFLSAKDKKSMLIYVLIGIGSIWFSNVSIIMLLTLGLYAIYNTHKEGEGQYMRVFLPIGLWVVSFGIYYFNFIHNHPTTEIMLEYWTANNAFLPWNILDAEFYIALFDKLRTLVGLMGFGHFDFIPAIIAGTGIVSCFLWRKQLTVLYLFFFPLLVHLGLSYLKLYPFDTRLILYLTPLLVTIFAYGLYRPFIALKEKYAILPMLLLIVPIVPLFFPIYLKIPTKNEEIKESLSYLNERAKPSERIYVYYTSKPAYLFYRNDYANLPTLDYTIFGSEHRKDWKKYTEEINTLAEIDWVIFSHTYWVKNKDGLNEEEYLLKSFENQGYRIGDKKLFYDSSVYELEKIQTVQ